jgi:S1-C subfamily serine protease
VIAFNGEKITSASELTAAVRLERANSNATITVVRAGKELTIKVRLGDAADAN